MKDHKRPCIQIWTSPQQAFSSLHLRSILLYWSFSWAHIHIHAIFLLTRIGRVHNLHVQVHNILQPFSVKQRILRRINAENWLFVPLAEAGGERGVWLPNKLKGTGGAFSFPHLICSAHHTRSEMPLCELPTQTLPALESFTSLNSSPYFFFFSQIHSAFWPWIVLCPNIDPLKHSKLHPDAQTTSALRHFKHLLQSAPLERQKRGTESTLQQCQTCFIGQNIFFMPSSAVHCSSAEYLLCPVNSNAYHREAAEC